MKNIKGVRSLKIMKKKFHKT